MAPPHGRPGGRPGPRNKPPQRPAAGPSARPRFQVEIKTAPGDRLGAAIRRLELQIETQERALEDHRTRFDRARKQHEEFAAKLRPLMTPAPHLREELGKFAAKHQAAARQHEAAEKELAAVRSELAALNKTRGER